MNTPGNDPIGAPVPASGMLPTAASPTVRGGQIFTAGRAPQAGTGNLLPGLELIRGLACLQVLFSHIFIVLMLHSRCLLYTSDAADDLLCVDLGGRRIIKK